MEKDALIRVKNRSVGNVFYEVPELHIERHFQYQEEKQVPYAEIHALFFSTPGGPALLKDYLLIKNREVIEELGFTVEPEYTYEESDVEKIMTQGSLDEFLDMLDFAPDGVLTLVKKIATDLPLNDVAKRDAILNKLGYDVSKAIEIKNTAFDDGSEDGGEGATKQRRIAVPGEQAPAKTYSVRRASTPATK